VQISTQPTTMSGAMTRNVDTSSNSKIRKDKNLKIINGKTRYKPGGISYHKHNNPQNDLNIWRSSIVKVKPSAIRVGISKDGNYFKKINHF